MEKKQFVVVGPGGASARRWRRHTRSRVEVMAIDINGERVEAIRDHVTHCVQANGMNREALVQLGVARF